MFILFDHLFGTWNELYISCDCVRFQTRSSVEFYIQNFLRWWDYHFLCKPGTFFSLAKQIKTSRRHPWNLAKILWDMQCFDRTIHPPPPPDNVNRKRLKIVEFPIINKRERKNYTTLWVFEGYYYLQILINFYKVPRLSCTCRIFCCCLAHALSIPAWIMFHFILLWTAVDNTYKFLLFSNKFIAKINDCKNILFSSTLE